MAEHKTYAIVGSAQTSERFTKSDVQRAHPGLQFVLPAKILLVHEINLLY